MTGNPIEDPVYLDPRGGAPELWPILFDPAVINVWCERPLRVTVQALLPGGATFTRTGVDIAPAPRDVVRSHEPLHIGAADGLDGSAMLAVSSDGSATWQVLDALRFHRHDGAAPGSTVISPGSATDVYPKQTWLGRLVTGEQGAGAVAAGAQGQVRGPGATALGRASAASDAVALGAGTTAGTGAVALAPGATASKDSQVVVGRNATATASPAGATVIGGSAVGGATSAVQIVDALSATEAGSVTLGRSPLDVGWLQLSEFVALAGDTVVPRHLAAPTEAVIAGASSTLGFYGTAGAVQPLVSTAGLPTDAPGRAALLSLMSALDRLGLVYLLDGATDDEFVDWSKTQAHDANLVLETGDADGSKAGDVNRVKRNATGPGTLTYQLQPEIGDVALRAFVLGSAANLQNEITVSVSPTGATWTAVPMTWQPVAATAASWGQTWGRNRSAIPTGMHYLRIKLDLNATASTPQLGRAIVRPRLTLASHTSRVDFTGLHNTIFRAVPTQQQTVVQSFAVDPVDGHIYWSQLVGDGKQLPGETAPVPYATREASGDIAITQMSMATQQILGVMYVKRAGQGDCLAVERGSDGLRLWIDADSSSNGFARALARVQFQNGAVLDGKTIPVVRPFGSSSASHGLSCAIDPAYNRITVKRNWPDPSNGRRHYLYDLTAFKGGDFSPLAVVDQAVGSSTPDGLSIGSAQGYTTWGNYLYSIEGNGGSNNAYLTSLDWRTGQVVQRTLVTSNPDLTYREPKGLSVWVPNASQPQTVRFGYGFAGGATGARHATLVTVDTFIA
ncbi:phage baseplate protein [Streptomyces yangpuensis]